MVEITVGGKKYLRALNDVVFDHKTHEEIGHYDASINKVILEGSSCDED